ncbi:MULTISPECIES: hypothetical protein [unclassified Chromohalobacter]|uniref:hypothetical protein n=1 Tax=unclassified Chromohalobacter TaxID=2628571 RepID=UPI002468FF2E|nr:MULTISPECIES: hypothetical protein [unclassified Chromohalobacter]
MPDTLETYRLALSAYATLLKSDCSKAVGRAKKEERRKILRVLIFLTLTTDFSVLTTVGNSFQDKAKDGDA